MPSLYFDYHASTPVDPLVVKKMTQALQENYGNPHSDDHSYGWAAQKATDNARKQVAKLIAADSDEIIFTSGATESNNLAILGFCRDYHKRYPQENMKRQIIVSSIEHKCVQAAAASLEQYGWHVSELPVGRNGIADIRQLKPMLSKQTALVAVMAVNNEVGTIQPISEIGSLCKEHGAIFHCDAAQAPTAIDIDVNSWGADTLSLSAHKMYGPKGIGALYIRRDLQHAIEPLMYGGGQENGIRPGTLPTPLCVGFGEAAQLLLSDNKTSERQQVERLRNYFWNKLKSEIPTCKLNGSLQYRHPGNLNICFPDVDAHHLVGKLQPSIAVSTGSACTTGIPEPSHVLTAMGLDMRQAESSVRVGMGRFTTEQEIEDAVSNLVEAVKECAYAEA